MQWALLLIQNSCCSMRKEGQIIWLFLTRVYDIFFVGQNWSRVYRQFKSREASHNYVNNFRCVHMGSCACPSKNRDLGELRIIRVRMNTPARLTGTKLFRQYSGFAFATRRPLSKHRGQNGIIFVLCVFPTDFVNHK